MESTPCGVVRPPSPADQRVRAIDRRLLLDPVALSRCRPKRDRDPSRALRFGASRRPRPWRPGTGCGDAGLWIARVALGDVLAVAAGLPQVLANSAELPTFPQPRRLLKEP